MENLSLYHDFVNHEGFRAFIRDVTIQRDAAVKQLISTKRPAGTPDDSLRGYIGALDWILGTETRVNRAIANAKQDAQPVNDEPIGSPMESDE